MNNKSVDQFLVMQATIDDNIQDSDEKMLLLLFSCPPVREVFPNHEVVMFQPQTGTSPYLGYVAYCYVYTS